MILCINVILRQKVPPNEVRDLDFANDASKILASAAAKLEKQSTQNDRKLTTKLLTDLIYFVTDTENTGGETCTCIWRKMIKTKLQKTPNMVIWVKGLNRLHGRLDN